MLAWRLPNGSWLLVFLHLFLLSLPSNFSLGVLGHEAADSASASLLRNADFKSRCPNSMKSSNPDRFSDWVFAPFRGKSKTLEDSFNVTLAPAELQGLRRSIVMTAFCPDSLIPASYNLFAFSFRGYLLILDMYGKIVAGRRTNATDERVIYLAPKFINSTTIVAVCIVRHQRHDANWVAASRFVLWNIVTNREIMVDVILPPEYAKYNYSTLHHDLEFNSKTDTFVGLWKYIYQNASAADDKAVYDVIFEVTLAGAVIWIWDARKWLPFDRHFRLQFIETGDCHQVFSIHKNQCHDWMHGNTLFWDIDFDTIYYNSRSLDTFFQIDKKSGVIVWSVGRLGSINMFNISGIQVPALFFHAHSLDKVAENTFIIFDNNFANRLIANGSIGKANTVSLSGAKLLRVSPNAAREIWQWHAPRPYFTPFNGAADLLPNGNVLVTFSKTVSQMEITRSGDILWELRMPSHKRVPYGFVVYRTERFYPRPLVQHPPHFCLHITDNAIVVTVWLKVWDTIKRRCETSGTLTVRNDQCSWFFQKPVTFPRYRQPMELHQNISFPEIQGGQALPECLQGSHAQLPVTISVINSDGVDCEISVPLRVCNGFPA